MRKYIPSIIVISLVAAAVMAAQSLYNTTQRDTAVAIALGDTTNAPMYTAIITFTNGWTISCVSTGLVFTAP